MTVREEETPVAPVEGKAAFDRILLKLSGEALMGDKEFGLELPRIEAIAEEIVECQKTGVEIAIVVGAGTSTAGCPPRPRAWTAQRRTTQGCSRRS